MLKTLWTLMRGQAASAAEKLADENALAILDQQMRDAGAGYERAKRALALAVAQSQSEEARVAGLSAQIADLETRVEAAMDRGSDDLAREGAQAVAALEADRDAARQAQSSFLTEQSRLRGVVARLGRRLADLERGRKIARAADAVTRARSGSDPGVTAAVSDAEATLARLRDRQTLEQAAGDAYDALDVQAAPKAIAEKLEQAGCGPRTKPTADDVLARLKARKTTAA
jgi:phage shock protein A